MKTIAIIQARMGSQRLPKKSLMKISKFSLLQTVINAIKKHDFVDEIVVATTNLDEDNSIAKECENLNLDCHRGDKSNVLSRFVTIAKQFQKEDCIVRVTADNPINNLEATRYVYQQHLSTGADYTCIENLSHTIYEFMKVNALVELGNIESLSEEDKEHVTLYFRQYQEQFNVLTLKPENVKLNSELDNLLTVDTKEDYDRILDLSKQVDIDATYDIEEIYNALKENISVS